MIGTPPLTSSFSVTPSAAMPLADMIASVLLLVRTNTLFAAAPLLPSVSVTLVSLTLLSPTMEPAL